MYSNAFPCSIFNERTKQTPESAAGDPKSAENITDKRRFAKRWQGSTRWVDGLVAKGLPHLKIGLRRVWILVTEADEWMRAQFSVRRRSPVVKGGGEPVLRQLPGGGAPVAVFLQMPAH